MIKRVKFTHILVTIGTMLVIIFASANASAAIKFRQISQVSYSSKPEDNAYHTRNLSKSTWVYNSDQKKPFSKRVFNLKSYPDTTWFISSTVRTYNKGKTADYYEIANKTGNLRGYVKTSALAKGFSPNGYQIIKEYWGNQRATFHIKNPKANLYVWNWNHTKKRANLKNYPGMNLSRSETVIMQHNNQQSKYYCLSGSLDGTNKSVNGYVAAKDLLIGKNPNHTGMKIVNIDEFVNNTDFNNYLKTGTNQKLAREVLDLFPNSQPDLGLSKIAVYNYGGIFNYDGDIEPISTTGYSDFISFPEIQKNLYKNSSASNATKISIIKNGLKKLGYTDAKRKSFKGYKLGIQIINNIKSYDSISGNGRNNSYVFILGKSNK
ncbi:D-alanyl-D-alanine carboxypeptidase [Lentilactobacillus kosonis]|uniref:D-alanyl-D-alanine carboxypeptidase n=1 Tax=Lentilactobacillus kosonis TaxID=2810561 RepID=A0A401FMZ5_9LACO|nr:D-alanyl-D-alanine carboxypeptidase [Lentilactobacillus kosonis]GAY73707.1 D-alanyl-D-alanine carboxypeptidase [Lentilactobacillus kosonis]